LRRNTTRLSDKASGKAMPNSPTLQQNNQIKISPKITSTNVKNPSSPNDLTNIFKKKSLFSKSFQTKWQKLDQIVSLLNLLFIAGKIYICMFK
jgi:hypothetical protein